MKAKFGLVVLLDALGTRSASIDAARDYLSSIDTIRSEIDEGIRIAVENAGDTLEAQETYKALNPRFFGDTILMTYEVEIEANLLEYFHRLTFVLNNVIALALELGLPFRGAVSLGEYVEKEHVVLGPAIADAANWYEEPDMVGIICTPATTNYLKASFAEAFGLESLETRPFGKWLLMYDVPLRTGMSLRTYSFDWVDCVANIWAGIRETEPLAWYYSVIRELRVPRGTESKYANTEAFVKYSLADRPGDSELKRAGK